MTKNWFPHRFPILLGNAGFLSLLMVGVFSVRGGAVPPAPGQPRTARGTCHVNRSAFSLRRMDSFGAPSLAPPAKNYSVIVIRVRFSDQGFQPGDNPSVFFQKVQDYYKENSFGVFVPTFTMSPVFTLSSTLATFGNNCGSDVSCRGPALISAAVAAADPSTNFSPYDHVMVYHAGYGEESTGIGSHIWSMFIDGLNLSTAEKSFSGATIVPELELGADALGVICHEYGHQLGLPDLYDTSVDGGRSTVGAWDLMDYPWTGTVLVGDNPPHLGAWSKRFLGFGSAVVVPSSGMISLQPAELAPGKSLEVYRSGPDYFLLEYRLKTSTAVYDKAIPQAAGLALWHVDDTVMTPGTFNNNVVNAPSENGFHHVGVDLIEADGIASYPPGSSDLWGDGGTVSSPATNLFNGAVSSLVMTGIQGVGGSTVTAQILFLAAKNSQTVARAISYPNPATGRARAGAPSGTWATLRLQVTRPAAPSTLKAALLTVSGERVREIHGNEFSFRSDLSRDYEWIYEFDWNGLDETGAEVASGVYYVQFEADGEKVRKPLVVQR